MAVAVNILQVRMKKYIAEGLATFSLVFFGTGSATVSELYAGSITHTGISIAFGLVVATMIYTFGDISGAHMNPAVTVAFSIQKQFPLAKVFPYITSQVLGALAASAVLHQLFPASALLGATLPSGSAFQSVIVEFVLSFFLMLTILNVTHGSKEKGLFAGLAIGGVVMLEALVGGPVSGASMNPARSIAPALISGNLRDLWIYLSAPLAGMSLSTVIFNYLKAKP
jgi:aquaporin NIP